MKTDFYIVIHFKVNDGKLMLIFCQNWCWYADITMTLISQKAFWLNRSKNKLDLLELKYTFYSAAVKPALSSNAV